MTAHEFLDGNRYMESGALIKSQKETRILRQQNSGNPKQNHTTKCNY